MKKRRKTVLTKRIVLLTSKEVKGHLYPFRKLGRQLKV
jgi:hypothetical protein